MARDVRVTNLESNMEVTTKTKTGDPIATFKAHALIVIAGTETHKLALHKDGFGAWKVTHPESGACVAHVRGQYQGALVSSKGYTLREARAAAQAQIDALIERIGSGEFNAVLARAAK